MRLRHAAVAALSVAATGLTGCQSLDFSRTVEHMELTKCREEAYRYPRALEDCENIGRAADY